MSCNDTYDICINQYASYKMPLQFTDQDNNAINISGWSISGSIKEKYKSTETVASFGLETVNPTSGSINLYLTPAQTAILVKSQYVYDVIAEITGSSPPETVRLLEGNVTVDPGVTDGQIF